MKPLATFANRLAFLQSSAWLPPALLLLAISSIFIFAGDRAYFDKDRASMLHSAKVLSISDNLSPEHRFQMFVRQALGEDGKPFYVPYSRFPIGGFALIKLTLLPFGNDLPTEIYAARMLMLLFFAASAILAYLSLSRIAASPWIALTAVLLAFSSAYALYFSDVIFNEGVIDLFAVLLVFHALVIFEQEGRFRQLLLKTCAALLLGWHVYALLLPFIAFGLLRRLIKTWSSDSPTPSAVYRLKHAARALIRSRYLTLGVVALLFGVSILAFNFTNEYFALNREKPLTELPSLNSAIKRTNVNPQITETEAYKYLPWPNFLARQFYRIGMMSLPYAFSPPYTDLSLFYMRYRETMPRSFVMLGIAAFGASLIGLRFVRRHKILLASLTLSGFCWALLVRGQVAYPWHHFETIFHMGVALTLFALILICIRRLAGRRLIAAIALAALPIFALSAFRMTQIDHLNHTSEFHRVATADFETIRNMTHEGNSIWVNHEIQRRNRPLIDYYLAGRVIAESESGPRSMPPSIDFAVTDARPYGILSLTPQNQTLFLYEWDDFNNRINQVADQADAPLVQSNFDVYHDGGGMLIYAKDDCSENDIADKFFLAVHPTDANDLPPNRRQYGFDNFGFHFYERVVQNDGRCIAAAPLPDYPIHHIHTGQYIDQADGSFAHTWQWFGKIHKRVPRAVWANPDEAIAQAGEPLTRSNFDIYLNDNNLIYLKDQCSADDAQPRFFLAVYPASESALSDDRRQYGYDDLSFRFQQRAPQNDERCIAITPLPDYPIDHIHTGQYAERADGSFEYTWEWLGELRIPISPDELAALDEAIAQAGEPLIRAHFNVYLIHDNLIYLKDGCTAGDTQAPFFLALYPAHESNLPAGRQQYGYDNIDFQFQDQGVRRGGRCIAVAPLPDYAINHINTGQYIQQDDGSFQHTWEGAAGLQEAVN